MKIDPTDKLQAVSKPAPVNPREKAGHGDFSAVFEREVARSESPPRGPVPVVPPSLGMMTGPVSNVKTAGGLLDSLERYRQLLADETASLKDIAPAVAEMERQSNDARKILNAIPESDPVKGIMRETVLAMTKEVERFNLGIYVED